MQRLNPNDEVWARLVQQAQARDIEQAALKSIASGPVPLDHPPLPFPVKAVEPVDAEEVPGAFWSGLIVACSVEAVLLAAGLLCWWMGPARFVLLLLILLGTATVGCALAEMEKRR